MTPWARRAGLLLVLSGLISATAVMQTTSASWNDSANFAAEVSSGTWGQPPIEEGGISAGNDDTVIEDIVWDVKNSRQFCTEVLVTGVASDPRHWAIDIDLTEAPFNGAAAGDVHTNGTGNIAIAGENSLQITGREAGGPWRPRTNNTPITDAQTAELTICVHNAPPPTPADASTYSVDVSRGTWTGTQACVVIVITSERDDLDAYPFFFGWTADVELADAIQGITPPNVPSSVTWTPTPDGEATMSATPSTFSPPQPVYTITSGYNLALRALGGGADSRTVTACVNGTIPKGNGKNNSATLTSTNPVGESIELTARVAVTTMPSTTSTTSTIAPGPQETTTNLPGAGSGPSPAPTIPEPTGPELTIPGATTSPTTLPPWTTPIEAPPETDTSEGESP